MVLRSVLDFLVPLLWLFLAVGVVFYLLAVRRRYGSFTAIRRVFSYRLLWPALFVVVVTIISASLVFIDPKEVGVKISLREPTGIAKEPLRSGLHMIIPLAEQVVRYPIIIQTYTMSGRPLEGDTLGDDAIQARTADGQLVIIDISVLYRVNEDQAVPLHVKWQNRYTKDLIRPGMRMAVRSEASKYTVDEINSEKRKVFENSLNEIVKQHTRTSGVMIEAVLVRNITFSPEYALSVEEKMTAKQRVTEAAYKAKQMANIANGEAERIRIKARAEADAIVINAEATATARVVKARAEAEALNMIAVALNERDNLLTFKYIEKLSPNIKAMLLPNNAPLILPMPDLEKPKSDDTVPAVNTQPALPGDDLIKPGQALPESIPAANPAAPAVGSDLKPVAMQP